MAKQADDVEAIITDVFRVSGIKLTADDPVIAILLVQEARLKALFEEQRIGIQQGLAEYAAEIDDALKETVAAAKELKPIGNRFWRTYWPKATGSFKMPKAVFMRPCSRRLRRRTRHWQTKLPPR